MRKWNKNENCISGDVLLAAYQASSALIPVSILLFTNTILTPLPRRRRLINNPASSVVKSCFHFYTYECLHLSVSFQRKPRRCCYDGITGGEERVRLGGSGGNERCGGVGFHESEVLDPCGRGIPGVGGGGFRVMQEMDGSSIGED